MPRPPLLPNIDWQTVFNEGKTYEGWLAAGEDLENRKVMEETRRWLVLADDVHRRLKEFKRPIHVVAFAEDWCGDVVRHVPVLEKLAEVCRHLHIRYLARADRPEVFARYLTNGGEAVPKFIFLTDRFIETGNWGPMTRACRDVIARGKACGDIGAARKRVAALYEADPGRHEEARELVQLMEIASTEKL